MRKRTENVSSLQAVVAMLALVFGLVLPTAAMAQGDFSFDTEDAEEVEEKTDEGEEPSTDAGTDTGGAEEEGGGDFNFGKDDLKDDSGEKKVKTVAVIAAPSKSLDKEQRQELQKKLTTSMGRVQGMNLTGPDAILGSLSAETDNCINEPLCLSAIGKEAKVDAMVIANVKRYGEDQLELDISYFNVEQKLFEKTGKREKLGDFGDVTAQVDPLVTEVFGIRIKDDQKFAGPEDSSVVQTVLAWSAGGLAVVSIGLGIYTGVQVNNEVSALEARGDGNGAYPDLTQTQAQAEVDRIQGIATRANIFYGVGVGLAVLSGVLFYIDSGSDVASEEELASSKDKPIKDLTIAPAVTRDGFGFGAGFKF